VRSILEEITRYRGKVVIDDQRAELKIDPLCGSLSGDHDYRFITEILNQRSPHVGRLGTRDVVSAFMLLQPVLIDFLRLRIVVRTVEQYDFASIARYFLKNGADVFLRMWG